MSDKRRIPPVERQPLILRLSEWFRTLPQRFSHSMKRWYSFNKQKIPMFFILIAGIVFTAFLDFSITRKGDLPPIIFESHIAAITRFVSSPLANMSGFFLFAIYMIAIVQMFNGFTFVKKQAPKSVFLITGLTLVQIILVALYTYAFFAEHVTQPNYIIDEVARRSYTIMIVGAAFLTVGTILTWFYVDWKYVKEIEE